MNEIKDVVVTNYAELLLAVKPFQPGGTAIRNELIRGFDMVKERRAVWAKAMLECGNAVFGDHKPATMPDPNLTRFWLDRIIERRLNGRRSGLTVVWDLHGKTYTFDPYSGEICCK